MILGARKPQRAVPSTRAAGDYQVNSPDSDISVTGWQMMALRGAANCGADIPKEDLEAAREYIQRSAFPGGGFGYQPGQGPNQARTGTGTLMMELFKSLDDKIAPGEHPKEALAGGDYLISNPPDNPGMEFYYYGVYYYSALNQLGGKYYDTVYPKLRDTLLAQQQPDGSFGGSNGQEQQAGQPTARQWRVWRCVCHTDICRFIKTISRLN